MTEPATLSMLRACMEGAIPAIMATCAPDGTPNVAYLSQVFYVDEQHVALSFQFFNKTRQNILAQPQATVLMLHPVTARFYRLHLRYLRTETDGPVFEGMRAQLAGIASHTGMAEVFQLRGADIYLVLAIETVDGQPLPDAPPRAGRLGLLRQASEALARCATLDELLNALVDRLRGPLGHEHAMVLILDRASQRLYTVASCGYPQSGVGCEVPLGEGVIGVAAQHGIPVRINHLTSAYRYSQAVRQHSSPHASLAAPEIAYPGLAQPHSQLAVPIVAAGHVWGVVLVESTQDLRFSYEDEDLLVALCGQLGAAMAHLQLMNEPDDPASHPTSPRPHRPTHPLPEALAPPALQVRCVGPQRCVFIGNDYLIKGVAGGILCKMLREYLGNGRCDFSNRELRLDPGLGLPDVADNLEARLVLLQRRLREQGQGLLIDKTGRGRWRLRVPGPLQLDER